MSQNLRVLDRQRANINELQNVLVAETGNKREIDLLVRQNGEREKEKIGDFLGVTRIGRNDFMIHILSRSLTPDIS